MNSSSLLLYLIPILSFTLLLSFVVPAEYFSWTSSIISIIILLALGFVYHFSNSTAKNTTQKRPRRLSNGASTHMLLGSMPPEKGKTNELIHAILRVSSTSGLAKHFRSSSKKNTSSDSDVETIKNELFERITAYDHFRLVPTFSPYSKLFFDFFSRNTKPEWISFPMNIDNHVFVHKGDEFQNDSSSINEYFEKELLNSHLPFQNSRPLWDLHLFCAEEDSSSLEPEKLSLILRTHHALADGLSLMYIITSLFSSDFEQNSSPLFKLASPPSAFSSKNSSVKNNVNESSLPSKFLGILSAIKTVLTSSATKDSPSSLYNPNKFEIESKRSVLFLTPIKTSKFNELRSRLCQELGVDRIPTNELLHALMSNAWRRCGECDDNIKKQERTRFLVPFSPPIDPEILSSPSHRHSLLPRNCVGFVSANIAKGKTFLERLQDSIAEWKRLKSGYEGHCALALSQYLVRYLPLKIKQGGCWDLASSHSLVFSNIAGPLIGGSSSIDDKLPRNRSNSNKSLFLFPDKLPDDDNAENNKTSSESNNNKPLFTLSVDAAMANAMPQMICVGSVDHFSFTLTFNEVQFPQTRKLDEFWREELENVGLI